MKIRKIKLLDLSACSHILENEYSREPYNEKFDRGAALKYIKSKYKYCQNSSFVMADEANKIIGFVFLSMSYWANGPQAILEEIVIDKKMQGQGCGKQLVKFAHEFLVKKKVNSVMLWVNKNANAYHFHQKNNYFIGKEYAVMFKNF